MSKALAPREWKWTKAKRLALDMVMAGVPQVQIAKELGKHRNSIGNWLNRPEFITELKTQLSRRQVSSKLRRQHTAQSIRQRVERLATTEVKKLEEGLKRGDTSKLRVARELLHEYRQMTAEERTEYGEAEKRIRYVEEHEGNNDNVPLTKQSLKEALLEAGRKGLIDVKAIMASGTAEKAFTEAASSLLISNPKLLDTLHAESKVIDVEASEIDDEGFLK